MERRLSMIHHNESEQIDCNNFVATIHLTNNKRFKTFTRDVTIPTKGICSGFFSPKKIKSIRSETYTNGYCFGEFPYCYGTDHRNVSEKNDRNISAKKAEKDCTQPLAAFTKLSSAKSFPLEPIVRKQRTSDDHRTNGSTNRCRFGFPAQMRKEGRRTRASWAVCRRPDRSPLSVQVRVHRRHSGSGRRGSVRTRLIWRRQEARHRHISAAASKPSYKRTLLGTHAQPWVRMTDLAWRTAIASPAFVADKHDCVTRFRCR